MRKFKFAVGALLLGITIVIAVGAICMMAVTLMDALGVVDDQNMLQILAFGPPMLAIALIPICSIMFYNLRYKHKVKEFPSDPELVHELARRAQELSQRLEALETILLDRSGQFRETAGRS